jgi:hypothetical protein
MIYFILLFDLNSVSILIDWSAFVVVRAEQGVTCSLNAQPSLH